MNATFDIRTNVIDRSVEIAAALRELDTDLPMAAALEEQAAVLDRAKSASGLRTLNWTAERD
jgi:hypothetical protein